MILAVVSDTHFGFKWNSERNLDSFQNAREAFEKAKKADAVLLPGDIFDSKTPNQEVFSKAFKLFKLFEDTGDKARIKDYEWKDTRTPVIAIHGTHERRSKEYVNPIELLEDAGVLVHLHNDSITLEKGGERVNIFGMSGVPERYASDILKKWNPTPEKGVNVLMLHQSIENFVYTDEINKGISLSDLPDGFDYIIDGHIHWKNLDFESRELPLVFPGSTITTQVRKKEAEEDKGIIFIDTESRDIRFEPLNSPREVFHLKIDVSDMEGREIVDEVIEQVVDKSSGKEKKPLVRVVLDGETEANFSKKEIREKIDSAIIKIGDNTKGIKERGNSIDSGEKVDELGFRYISRDFSFNGIKEIFEKLCEGDSESVLEEFEKKDLDELEEFMDDLEGEENKEKDVKKDGKTVLDYFGG